MKYRPDDAELLDAIASLLEDEVMPAVGPGLAHKVRVAANLARILQRQQELEPAALERERAALGRLLGTEGDIRQLRAELDRRLRAPGTVGTAGTAGTPGTPLPEAEVWEVLVATARDDLAAAKPGYDGWEGE